MKIIVDANIVFSAILNTNGKIADLLINSKRTFTFIAPEFLRYEIKEKYEKLQSISGLNIRQVMDAEYLVSKEITFISDKQINFDNWQKAYDLVHDVDVNDIQYVAYAKQFGCKIWSGDKKLFNGLKAKGFVNLLTTDELFELRSKKKK